MAEIAHSIPAPGIHEIAGSSPPGTGRPVFRPTPAPRPRPQTKPRLDGDAERQAVNLLAAQHGPDAEIIELAGRVVALAARENKASGWVGTIEDYITFKGPQHPMCDDRRPGARGKVREMALPDLRATLARELPHDPPSDWVAEIRQSIARMEAYNDAVQALEQRLDLARIEKRRSRMFRRLIRWATRLTAMVPVTHAGLKAKAEAQAAVDSAGNFDNWTQELAGSVGRDAVRIIEDEADARWRAAQDADGELLSLIARHGPASKAWDDADEASTPVCMTWWEARPSMPASLRGRLTDYPFEASGRERVEGSTSHFTVYIESDIECLRARPDPVKVIEHRSPAPWNSNETVVRCERVPDERMAYRKAEIIEAWDTWQAEIERLRESTGLNAANAVIDAAAHRVNRIEDAILDYQPRTFEGLQAKARWIASAPLSDERAQHLLRDLCRMPPIAIAPPAQVTPSMDVVETYRTFLDMEFRYLNWETHGTAGPSGGIWLDNPAGRLHGGDGPQPSSRAITVLTALGLMPNSSAEDKRDAASRAA